MMCTEPVIRRPKPAALPKKRLSQQRDFINSLSSEPNDLENAYGLKDVPDDLIPDPSSFKHLTFAQVTDQIWHFSSVDHGPRCKSFFHVEMR